MSTMEKKVKKKQLSGEGFVPSVLDFWGRFRS
jgi:hypothetical protein